MRCDEVSKLTMTYIEGKLPGDKVEWFERHLASCPLCRKSYSDEVEMAAAFKADTAGAAGADFTGNVMKAIDYELARNWKKVKAESNTQGKFAIALGALLIMSIASIWVFNVGGAAGSGIYKQYFESARAALVDWGSAVSLSFSGYFSSVTGEITSGWSSLSGHIARYSLVIAFMTTLAGVACIGLVAGVKDKLSKELGT